MDNTIIIIKLFIIIYVYKDIGFDETTVFELRDLRLSTLVRKPINHDRNNYSKYENMIFLSRY